MIFQCNKCLKFFSYKSHYNNHLRRKVPCKINNENKLDQIENSKNETNETTTSSSQNVVNQLLQRSQNTTSEKIDIVFLNSKENGFKCKDLGSLILLCNGTIKSSPSLDSI